MTVKVQTQGPKDPRQETSGRLYVVATPIGHRDDWSLRAQETLKTVDWIAAEDTRHSQALMQHYGIDTPLWSLHEHNEQAKMHQLADQLQAGAKGALISDAGTPLINDPGYRLVRHLRGLEIDVIPIPGPSAVIAALSAAGVATDRFSFEGFLPAKPSKRQKALAGLCQQPQTLVFYESPHRLLNCLRAMAQTCPQRQMVVAKELSKLYESFVSGTPDEVVTWFEAHSDAIRGEFVVILDSVSSQPADPQEAQTLSSSGDGALALDRLIEALLTQGLAVKQIVQCLMHAGDYNKKKLYAHIQKIKSQSTSPQ